MIGANEVMDARRALGHKLAAFRKAAGQTQVVFSRVVLLGRSSLANIETGRQRTERGFWQRCDAVLSAGGLLVADYDLLVSLERRHLHRHATGSAESDEDRPGTSADAASAATQRCEVVLTSITAVAAAAGLTGRDDTSRFYRIGMADVIRVQAITVLYRSLDYEYGGGALYPHVARFAEALGSLLDSPRSDDVDAALLTAVAESRQLAGWAAFDSGRHADGLRHWVAAERAAVAAGDVRLAARIRYCQARQFQHLRHNRDAIDCLRLAGDHLGADATPAITAMLRGAEAASRAALGDTQGALACLDAADAAFDRVRPEAEPAWMGFFDRGELLAQYGRVYRDFARTDRRHGPAAVTWVSDAINAFGPQNVRSRVLNQVGLCSALLLAGEPEHASHVGVAAIASAHGMTSPRVFDRLRNLHRDLAPYAASAVGADLGSALSDLAASHA